MTPLQEKTIELYRTQYTQSCGRYVGYSAPNSCKFNLYKSEDERDKNITIVYTSVVGISEESMRDWCSPPAHRADRPAVIPPVHLRLISAKLDFALNLRRTRCATGL